MSTNFYWAHEPISLPTGVPLPVDRYDPEYHIGKSSAGRFAWAQDPALVERVAAASPEKETIQNEYGVFFTWAEFCAYIADDESDTSKVGMHFG